MARQQTLKIYYAASIFSVIFAVIGFGYNAWRLEVSEQNTTVRTASFEVMTAIAELEQNIFSAVYDNDSITGSARIGWVKVGLINDLSLLISPKAAAQADKLKNTWQIHWSSIAENEESLAAVNKEVALLRDAIKQELRTLN
ncbi:hypothetical protein ACFSJY_01210 [Thalassotalea euphylliae]|uniref:hypothetical protein n=1 Tax=Thalassotalea euphylliae TaxID=1655234 RepID=UPI00362B1A5D